MNALSRILVLKDGAHIHVSQCSLEAQAQFSAYARLLATVEQYEQLFREDLKLHSSFKSFDIINPNPTRVFRALN